MIKLDSEKNYHYYILKIHCVDLYSTTCNNCYSHHQLIKGALRILGAGINKEATRLPIILLC
jgi:hypothetical protein